MSALNEYYNFTISTKNDDLIGADVDYFYDNDMSPYNYHLWKKTDPYTYADLGRLYLSKQDPTVLGEFTYFIETVSTIPYVRKNYGTIFARRTYTNYYGVGQLFQ